MQHQNLSFSPSSYIDLEESELRDLETGKAFITVVRPVNHTMCIYGDTDVIYVTRQPNAKQTRYALKTISALCYQGKWHILMHKLNDC